MNSENDLKENNYIMDKIYDDVMKDLRDGVCRVTFTKKDGTERKMKCTLNEKFMPKVEFSKDAEATKKEPNKAVVKCWDLEKEAWRSFRVDSIRMAYLETYGDKV